MELSDLQNNKQKRGTTNIHPHPHHQQQESFSPSNSHHQQLVVPFDGRPSPFIMGSISNIQPSSNSSPLNTSLMLPWQLPPDLNLLFQMYPTTTTTTTKFNHFFPEYYHMHTKLEIRSSLLNILSGKVTVLDWPKGSLAQYNPKPKHRV